MSLLLSQLGAPAATPKVSTAFDLPSQVQRPIGLLTWINLSLALTVVTSQPFGQTDWPLPKAPPASQQSLTVRSQFLAEPKIELLTLGSEFELPQGSPYPISLRTHTQNLLTSTLGVTPTPFVQTDWPNPKAPAQPERTTAARSQFLVEPKVELLTMGARFDLPIRAPRPIEQTQTVRSQFLVEPKVEILTMGSDFDLPVRAPRPIEQTLTVRSQFLQEPKIELLTMGKTMALPVKAPQPIEQTQAIRSQFLAEPKIELLTMGFDFDLPQDTKHPIALRSHTQNLLETTLSFTASPFTGQNWPNPAPLAPFRQADTRISPALYAIVAASQPFNQTDWPTLSTWRLKWVAWLATGVSHNALTLPASPEIHQRLPLNPFRFRRSMPPATAPWRAARIRLEDGT